MVIEVDMDDLELALNYVDDDILWIAKCLEGSCEIVGGNK